jgi:hypothetical protein
MNLIPNSILILNFSSPQGERLALFLRGLRLNVLLPEESGRTLRDLINDHLRLSDFVVFDLTNLDHGAWSELRRICRIRKHDGKSLMVLGVSRQYLDPTLYLLIEKLGVKIVYAIAK